ncbi:fumarylacetoacetate hydrolase domain-containing protein 2-like [Bombyx mandarina]|uniref:Fumarylacetoacetate hydrolase isoform A n=2 Tax=Bombyx TaxID=7090 RepID=Q2F601_BOMMO|nr:fumarylacetoacetase [Bombyx mori]XP_028037967.1 fumarylacetoacetate hydrolase domain-containing protein 2-like [Bombyx mandarina]XP_028037968.1 fumarylacetoacetate hydrolase domain-containing protein 2-like [Bombyx mandarina]XP_028037969.1 fumarylacetoacetate hydrolase domain-containing protein 2-like [Bombyx mandarina]XP_037876462.1 fumarylacetoacetase isoform X1 [Bombyx mori]ABD36216.1 fumarylacetoacetate hydrolase isoform A [Bombyx mori]
MSRVIGGSALSFMKSHILSKSVNKIDIFLNTIRCFSVTKTRNMKLVQFSYKDSPKNIRVGYLEGDDIVDINKADSSLPTTLLQILRNGDLEKVKKLKSTKPATIPLSSVTLTAPIHGVDKILCIGLNYKDHCQEQNLTPPPVPMVFSKFSSTIIGPDQPVRIRTDVTKKVDWEVELCVVVGREASCVREEDALQHVAGYTVAQDISARDWQKEKNMGQFLLGKSMDTFCPLGPCVLTSDEVGAAVELRVSCSLNGVLKQSSSTAQLVHSIPSLLHRISSVMTLVPGDLILTGTPGGVGMYRQPPEYLQPGDVLTSEIEKIGAFDVRIEKF